MAPLLVFGLAYLWVRNALHTYQILGVAGFLAFSGGVVTLLLLGLWRPELLEGTLNGLQNAANALARRLRRKPWLADDWAQRNAAEFSGAALGIAKNPAHLGRTLVLALGIHLLDVLGLYAVFLAYRQPVDLGAVAVGFGLDVVFSVLSFIPHGIGVADGAITLALTSLGVPAAKALVVALVARGLNIWLPFVPGLFFLRKVRSFGSRGAAP